jgi:Protein of unknown function (DUF2892)
MKVNMGNVDRGLRVVIGLALVIAAATGAIGLWGWLGLVPIATGFVGFCPAYLPFGLSTCKKP